MTHIEHVWDTLEGFDLEVRKLALPIVIANGNISVIYSLSRPAMQSGQSLLRRTCEIAERLKNEGGPAVRL
jgi:hypothetical protein